MAVTLSTGQLAPALRLGTSAEETAEATRLLTYAAEVVTHYAPDAPDAVHNEAAIRVAAYHYDMPNAPAGEGFANTLRNSGAGRMLLPYRVHRAGSTAEAVAAAQQAVGSVDNPVVGVRVLSGRLVVTFADGSTNSDALPAGTGDGTDQVARDAAAAAATSSAEAGAAATAAQTDIDTHEAATHNTDTDARELAQRASDKIDGHVANPPPAVDQAARDAASTAFASAGAAQTDIDDHEANHPEPDVGDDAYDWATEGHDAEQVPTVKVNLSGVQSQIDRITDELTHEMGPVTEVLGQLGSGNDSLRYTIANDTVGSFDVSVTVVARVQLNELVTFSGTLRITEDGGGQLGIVVPPADHNYSHHHEATLTFIRRGMVLPVGQKTITFTTFVTGQNPPDVHFIEVGTLKLTPTALVNAANVGEFVADWAETGNADAIPSGKLTEVHPWALEDSPVESSPTMIELGRFVQDEVDAIPNGGEATFLYRGTVRRDTDGTLAYIGGGWESLGSLVPSAGTVPGWYYAAFVNGGFTAGTPKAATVETPPIGPFGSYEALRAAVVDGSVKQIAVRISENDADDGDSDHGIHVIPNVNLFYLSPGAFDTFPAHALSIDPVRFRVTFGATGVTVEADATIPSTPLVQLRIGVWV